MKNIKYITHDELEPVPGESVTQFNDRLNCVNAELMRKQLDAMTVDDILTEMKKPTEV